jgi:hypothetical protein
MAVGKLPRHALDMMSLVILVHVSAHRVLGHSDKCSDSRLLLLPGNFNREKSALAIEANLPI